MLTEAEFDELFGSTSDLNELLVTPVHGAGGGSDGRDRIDRQWQTHSAPPDSRHTLAALIAQAKQPVSLPDVDVPRSDPVQARVAVAVACLCQLSVSQPLTLYSPLQWVPPAGLSSGAHLGAAPPLKRPSASGEQVVAAEQPSNSAAAAAARARRQAQRREKAGSSGALAGAVRQGNGVNGGSEHNPGLVIGLGRDPVSGVSMLASGTSQPAADAWQQSADAAAAASAAQAQLLGRVESLEKELRSALMRLQFMNKQNSTQTLKIESLEARNVALEKEVGRLRALWQSAQVFLDQGAGI